MNRYVGRQLTRMGALCQRVKLLAVAELSFRAATRLHPDPAWYVRLGKIRESRDRWAAAENAYARSLDTASEPVHRATAHYRQARARARRKDWDGAEEAYATAVELRPDIPVWHAHRAENYEKRGDWTAAASSYREAAKLQPDQPEWRARLARGYVKAGRPDQAVEAGEPVADHASLVRALLVAYEQVGDWPAVAHLLGQLVDREPDDYTVRMQLVECLERLYLVPFWLDRRGSAIPHQLATEALTQAIGHLRHLTSQAEHHAGAPHKLGMLFERSGQLAEAAGAYRLAMQRLAELDAWWCHRAAHEWAFRLAYVSRDQEQKGRVARRVVPSGDDRLSEPVGFFDAVMFRHGLQLSGFLRPWSGPSVDIYLDGSLLKRVQVNRSVWRPVLRYDITHGLLGDFPEHSLLTVRAGGQPLVTVGGAAAVEVRVPGGRGAVAGKLASGLSPTKKGGWPRTGAKLAQRGERYLEVYERAKELLDAYGRQLFLCYGTLLGCHREGQFIPGDDDFDVSYVSHAADAERYRQECQSVAIGLLRQGMDVNLSINGRLFKVGLDGIWLDITPMWFYKGRAWAFDAHDLTADAVEPVRATKFLDREVYVPRDPEAFLADAYGPQWRTPQPDFRYYRSKADDQVLSQMWAKPSEVRHMARLAEAERATNPAAGRFVGVGYPGYPGFSWLTVPEGPRPPSE